jgi:hypothetical protein
MEEEELQSSYDEEYQRADEHRDRQIDDEDTKTIIERENNE